MRLLPTVLALTFLGAACSSPPAVIPTRNLEHPSDMTFVCVQEVVASDGTTKLSGQPMEACHPRDAADPAVVLSGARNMGTFAFIANPGRNELAIADMDRGRLLDLTPLSAGYGMLPIGGNPEAIASTQDGCWVVTANRTSCDFTMLDPAYLLAPTFSSGASMAVPASTSGEGSHRVVVKTHSGTRALSTATGEIAFLPSPGPDPAIPDSNLCQPNANAPNARPKAVATFPSCDMVALLEFSFGDSTATIVDAYYVRPDLPGGFLAAGGDPVCPSDCSKISADNGVDGGTESADGGGGSGATIDGGASTSYLQPLALMPDGTRVYVGSLLDTAITSLDIGAAGLSNPARLNLAEKPIGVTRLRLAIDPYRAASAANADGTTGGAFLRDRGEFLYAIARDDSIRVVEIADQYGVNLATPIECDANIVITDPSVTEPAKGCFPVGSGPRRPLAEGPGIRIPPDILHPNPDSPPPLPRDISFAELRPIDSDTNYQSLSGQFGFVVASSGQVYVLNLAPTGEDAAQPATTDQYQVFVAATHSFRDTRDIGKRARTPLAMSIAPQRQVIVSDQAFPTTATYSALDGPMIRSFILDIGQPSTPTTTWLDYPDLDTVISRSWSVIWEGALPLATRSSGIVQSFVAGGIAGKLSDSGADFCASDTHPGDVLMFSGCAQNSDCQPDDKFTCRVAVSGARGMCLPIDSASRSNLIEQCGRFMGSRMRYEITQAKGTELTLQLKLDEVPKTTLNPCTKETEVTDCRPDVEHGKLAGATPDGGAMSGAFECVQVYDPTQSPHLNEPPRCVKRCSIKPKNGGDSECRAGHVCESVPGTLAAPETGFCVEAPPIDSSCFLQPTTSYSVRAGHSFMVYGSSMPALASLRAASDGTCQPPPTTDKSLVARIPLSAPKCPTDSTLLGQAKDSVDDKGNIVSVAPFFVQQLSAQVGSNPCLYQGGPYHDGDSPEPIMAGAPAPDNRVRAFFQNPQIRFVMTNLDQYAGDLLALHFELQYGYVPMTVAVPTYEVQLTMGTRILTGPTKTPESPIRHNPPTNSSFPYLYVVDQGRTALTPGSRGQVLRINPRAGNSELAYFDTTLSGSTPFQIQ
jgi:hypothetical protein